MTDTSSTVTPAGPVERRLNLPGSPNFRDAGGYTCARGRVGWCRAAGAGSEGEVHVYFGSTETGPFGARSIPNPDGDARAEFGFAVEGCDVDADGFADLVVGAPGASKVSVTVGLIVCKR